MGGRLLMRRKLWNKDFILFLVSTAQASFGEALSGVAFAFLVLKLTNSPSAMAITLALKFTPSILTPIIATFIDRIQLKFPIIISNFLRSFILIIVWWGVKNGLFGIYAIYNMVLLSGLIDTIHDPAAESLIPNLIPKEYLARGNSLLGVANQSMVLIGLILGGIMVALFGPEISLFIEGICYSIAGILLFFVSMPSTDTILKKSFYEDFILGFKIVKFSYVIFMIMMINLLLNLITAPINVLLPIHMIAIEKGSVGYGVFMGLLIGGLLFGSAIIAVLGKKFDSLYSIALGWFGFGIAHAGLGFLNSFYFSLCWAFLLGVNVSILNTGTIVVLQTVIPAEFRARIFGTLSAVCRLGVFISLFILSYIIKNVTVGNIFISIMVLSFIFTVVWFFTIKKCGHDLLLKPIDTNSVEKLSKTESFQPLLP